MVKITWLGHAAFKIETTNLIVFIDPWIKGNPVSPFKNYKEITKANYIFVTHDHNDHGFNDAVKICKKTGASFVGVYELANKSKRKGVKKTIGGNIGGEVILNDFKVYFTQAIHSSNIGIPCGFIINFPEYTIFHTGDTAFYSDLSYYSELYNIDLMLIPICSNYMMGIKEATWAIQKIKPKKVIPMHYNTFPRLNSDPEHFKKMVGKNSSVEILNIGNTLII